MIRKRIIKQAYNKVNNNSKCFKINHSIKSNKKIRINLKVKVKRILNKMKMNLLR